VQEREALEVALRRELRGALQERNLAVAQLRRGLAAGSSDAGGNIGAGEGAGEPAVWAERHVAPLPPRRRADRDQADHRHGARGGSRNRRNGGSSGDEGDASPGEVGRREGKGSGNARLGSRRKGAGGGSTRHASPGDSSVPAGQQRTPPLRGACGSEGSLVGAVGGGGGGGGGDGGFRKGDTERGQGRASSRDKESESDEEVIALSATAAQTLAPPTRKPPPPPPSLPGPASAKETLTIGGAKSFAAAGPTALAASRGEALDRQRLVGLAALSSAILSSDSDSDA